MPQFFELEESQMILWLKWLPGVVLVVVTGILVMTWIWLRDPSRGNLMTKPNKAKNDPEIKCGEGCRHVNADIFTNSPW
jgi:hypothetical protein